MVTKWGNIEVQFQIINPLEFSIKNHCGINVKGSRLLSYRKNTWLRTMCYLQIIWWENKKFHQRSWSATILHREDMVQAGCD